MSQSSTLADTPQKHPLANYLYKEIIRELIFLLRIFVLNYQDENKSPQ